MALTAVLLPTKSFIMSIALVALPVRLSNSGALYHPLSDVFLALYSIHHQYRHTDHVQPNAQIKHRQDLLQISMEKALPKRHQSKAHQHQHRFVGDGDDHQHQGRHRDRNILLPHIVYLGGLAAGGGGQLRIGDCALFLPSGIGNVCTGGSGDRRAV